MDKVIKILRGCLPFVDFDKETALVDDGILECRRFLLLRLCRIRPLLYVSI